MGLSKFSLSTFNALVFSVSVSQKYKDPNRAAGKLNSIVDLTLPAEHSGGTL